MRKYPLIMNENSNNGYINHQFIVNSLSIVKWKCINTRQPFQGLVNDRLCLSMPPRLIHRINEDLVTGDNIHKIWRKSSAVMLKAKSTRISTASWALLKSLPSSHFSCCWSRRGWMLRIRNFIILSVFLTSFRFHCMHCPHFIDFSQLIWP